MTEETKESTVLAPVKVEPTLEALKYKEELAAKMGLPSSYGMGLMKELARDLVESGMVPKHFANNPMGVYMAAMRGREMELEPMESIMETFWSAPGGNLGIYAKKMLQLMHRGGVLSKFIKEDAEGCEILFTPPSPHEPYTARFDIAEAQTAGLVKSDSNWMKWRVDMNRARAISRGYRALMGTFGKLSTFGGYSKEEMEDSGMVNGRSTMADPTPEDRKRAEVLEAQTNQGMGDFKVGVKVVPGPAVAATIVAPSEAVKQAYTEALTPTHQWVICMPVKNGAGDSTLIPVAEEMPQTYAEAAILRARALANDKRLSYCVTHVVNGVVMAAETQVFNPPAHSPNINRAAAPADPPAAPETAAAPTEASKSQQASQKPDDAVRKAMKEKLNALAPLMLDDKGQPISAKTAMARFKMYFSGFFGVPVKELPTYPEDYPPVLEALEGILRQDLRVLQADYEVAGRKAAERMTEVRNYLAKQWSGDSLPTVALGYSLCCQWNKDAEEFKTWFEANQLRNLPLPDAHALLRMALKTRDACLLIRVCRDHNLSISKICQQIEERGLEMKIEEAEPGRVQAAVQGFIEAIKAEGKTKQAEAEPEQKAQPEDKEEDGGNLFEDL